VAEPGFVILCVECSRSVEVDARAGLNAAHGQQPEGGRLGRFATFQSVVQRFGDKGAEAEATGFSCATHLLYMLVVKGDSGPHDALA